MMSIVRDITRSIRLTFVLWLLTAVIYPLIMIVIGQVFFPFQANGSIVQNLEGQNVGSVLIGQVFTSPQYFQSRPSAINYSSFTQQERDLENIAQRTGVSGASNFAPSNPDLIARIDETVSQLEENGITPTVDLVYASGSGLDPHITVEAAFNQLDRVAQTRNLSPEEIAPLIAKHTQGRFLGIFGEPGVNVLTLNRELDVLQAPLE